jgi:hypothetical protein
MCGATIEIISAKQAKLNSYYKNTKLLLRCLVTYLKLYNTWVYICIYNCLKTLFGF